MRGAATNLAWLRRISAGALGGVAALLLARLVLRLLAARPDNPVIAVFFALSAPPQGLAWLDREQPRFGATLELSTLALFALVFILGVVIARANSGRRYRLDRRREVPDHE